MLFFSDINLIINCRITLDTLKIQEVVGCLYKWGTSGEVRNYLTCMDTAKSYPVMWECTGWNRGKKRVCKKTLFLAPIATPEASYANWGDSWALVCVRNGAPHSHEDIVKIVSPWVCCEYSKRQVCCSFLSTTMKWVQVCSHPAPSCLVLAGWLPYAPKAQHCSTSGQCEGQDWCSIQPSPKVFSITFLYLMLKS